MDWFAQPKGGSHRGSDSKDAALWHYLPSFNEEMVPVIHNEYMDYASADMYKCRALRSVLANFTIALNAHKCILVNRETTIHSFGEKGVINLLGYYNLCLRQGIKNKEDIVSRIGENHL
ncbi:hypothetical protein GOP47_0010719 [Adiantum capillus-veneris]|uniref:Uncharacterized protein n=1 Tax=Adiantum capillus-veneris TaxID=13818 RepID=A0A9D4UVG4_ADICA|nr:hypothetical protein GOP47_0010719 [Adiantum capillus-veneris]